MLEENPKGKEYFVLLILKIFLGLSVIPLLILSVMASLSYQDSSRYSFFEKLPAELSGYSVFFIVIALFLSFVTPPFGIRWIRFLVYTSLLLVLCTAVSSFVAYVTSDGGFYIDYSKIHF